MRLTKIVLLWTDSFYEVRFVGAVFNQKIDQGIQMAIKGSKNVETVLLISIGAVLGANLRYWLGVWVGQRWGTQYPIATLIINLTGSLILGFFITMITERFLIDPRWRVFFAIGFLGSYTTFSSYTYESIALIMSGNWAWGLFNLLGSSILGGTAVVVGILLSRWL